MDNIPVSTSGLCNHEIGCVVVHSSSYNRGYQIFELFQIFLLPVFSASGNFSLHCAPMPEFLAVGKVRQTELEAVYLGHRSWAVSLTDSDH